MPYAYVVLVARAKSKLPSAACTMQPLESVTEFDVPVPIPHTPCISPKSPLPPLLLAAKSSWNFLLRLQKFRLLLFSLLPRHLLFLRLFAWAVGSAIPYPPIPLFIHSTACHVSFMFVCLFVIRYAPYEIWRIWYTEYVKLKFPTMLLLFLTAPRHVPIYVPRSVSQPQLLLHLPYLSPYFVCFV